MVREIGSEVAGGCVRPLAAKCCVRASLADESRVTLCAPRRYRWLWRRPRGAEEVCGRSSSMLEVVLYFVCISWSEASAGGLVVCFVLVVDIFISLLSVVEFVVTDLFFNRRGCRRLSSSTVV